MNIAQHLAATLKTLRQQRGWSLSRLAEETGVSKAMLGQIERNESRHHRGVLLRIKRGGRGAGVRDDDRRNRYVQPGGHLPQRRPRWT